MDRLHGTSSIRISDDSVTRDIRSFIEPRPPIVSHPFLRPKPHKGINLISAYDEDTSTASDEPELVQVYLRLRPCKKPSPLYEVLSDKQLVTLTDTTTAGHGRKTQQNIAKSYSFSKIFNADTSQKEIFEKVVKANLNKLPDGQSYNLMTYGASGSGKTYTLMGTVTSPGLVPRSLEYLFKIIDAAQQPLYKPTDYGGVDKLSSYDQETELNVVKRFSQMSAPLRNKYRRMSVTLNNNLTTSSFDLSARKRHYVWVSFIEIYNESLYDLLQTTDRNSAAAKLRMREDPNTGLVYAKGLTQAFVRSGEEAYEVMVAGKHNLQVAATGVHARSSRSHCIFTITLITETECGVRTSYVRLCDLAGCERATRTNNTGARMLESRAINTSLHVLQRCLHALRSNRPDAVVPYRESKLTRLLGLGLSGGRGESVSMVMTVNPDVTFLNESRHVLHLAAVVKDIQLNQTYLPAELTVSDSTVRSTFTESCVTSQDSDLAEENMHLRATVERLHFELQQRESECHRLSRLVDEKNALITECVEEAKAMTTKYYEGRLKVAERRHARELEELKEEIESYKRRFNIETSSQQDTQQDEASELTKSDDGDIDDENRETLDEDVRETLHEDDDNSSCSDESESEERTSPKQDLVLLIESDSEDELNQSLEPRFKVPEKKDIRDIQNISKQALIEQEIESSDDNDDVSVESNRVSNDKARDVSKDDLDGDLVEWPNDVSRVSFGNEKETAKDTNDEDGRREMNNETITVTKEQTQENNTQHSSNESAIDKTPVDFEENCVEETKNKSSTEGYESATENDVIAETANFAQRKAYSVDVAPPEVDNTENIFRKPERGTFVFKDKDRVKMLHLAETPKNKRMQDSLTLFEQFEEDVKIQLKKKDTEKTRSGSIMDYAKYKMPAANFELNSSPVCKNNKDFDKAVHKYDIVKENDVIDKTKSSFHEKKQEILNKSKTCLDPNNAPANQLEMVTLDLNSEQCNQFFRKQEAKTQNNNMPKSNELNPINDITFNIEVNKCKTAVNAKNSIDIFDDIPPSPLKDKDEECSTKETVLTDLTKDFTNVSAQISDLLTNTFPKKESELDAFLTGNDKNVIPIDNGGKTDEEVNKREPKPYKMMKISNIFVKSGASPSRSDNNETKKDIYDMTNSDSTLFNEQEFTKNVKSNLVSFERQHSEIDSNIEQVGKDCNETNNQEKHKTLDPVVKKHTKISVTAAEASEKDKETANVDSDTSESLSSKICTTISVDSEFLADNIESKLSKFDKFANTGNTNASEFENIVKKDDVRAKTAQNQRKDTQPLIIASNETKDKVAAKNQEEKEVKIKESDRNVSEIPQNCDTISVDFDLLAENVATRPSEFEQLAKNVNTRASEFDNLAENIVAFANTSKNVAKVTDILNKFTEKEINKPTEIEKDIKTVELTKKGINKKEFDEIVNKHEATGNKKATEKNFIPKIKTRVTEYLNQKPEPSKRIESGSLNFENLAQNISSRSSEFEKLTENIDTRPSEFEKLVKNVDLKSFKVDKQAKCDDKQSLYEKQPKNTETKQSEIQKIAKFFETRPSEFEKLVKNTEARPSEFEKVVKNIETRPSEFEKLVENTDARPSEFEKLVKNIETRPSEFEKLVENTDARPSEFEKLVKNIETRPSEFEKLVKNIETRPSEFEKLVENTDARPSEFEKLVKNIETRPSEFEKLVENTDARPTAFEKLVTNVETRPTEFEKLVKSFEIRPTESEKLAKIIETRASELEKSVEHDNKNIKTNKTKSEGGKGPKLRYNLRHKTDQENEDVINIDHVFTDINFQKLVSKTQFQNDPKTPLAKPKRNLRLRKPKTIEDTQKTKEADNIESQKLKDIVNLRSEFADVIMGEKVTEKSVQKSPSPEIKSGEENLSADACQSVPRSRRKLYTPRAELLEESTHEEGAVASGERIRIPRPSYQKTRTRRRLN